MGAAPTLVHARLKSSVAALEHPLRTLGLMRALLIRYATPPRALVLDVSARLSML